MKCFRNAFLFAACLIASHAGAAVHHFSFSAILTGAYSALQSFYTAGTTIDGTFKIDDAIEGVYSPSPNGLGVRRYHGNYSGTLQVGANTITFADSYSYVYNANAGITYLTMVGGNTALTGGTISETQAPGSFAIGSFEIQLFYPFAISPDMPIHEILSGYPVPQGSVYLDYGNHRFLNGVRGDLTALDAAPVPEPHGGMLTGLALLGLVAVRKGVYGSRF